MSDDRGDEPGRLVEQSAAFAGRARAAERAVTSVRGQDATGSVSVALDDAGRVVDVRVVAGWRAQVGVEGLGAAVREAVQAAGVARLSAWAGAFADDGAADVVPEAVSFDRDGLAEQLNRLTSSRRMTTDDTRAALLELLTLVEDIEHGVDEVSERLPDAQAVVHTGRSGDGRVTVSVTGAGEVRTVRYDQRWLLEAHEVNVGRQTTAAFTAAYGNAARESVDRLIAGSRLGTARQATQDPFGLARRPRLTD